MRREAWPMWPSFDDAQAALVADVIRSGRVNYWTGELGKQFEAAYALHVGKPHAVAVMNGTVALELALRSLGVGAGDEVIVPCRTFIATASAVVAVGGTPILADVSARTHNICRATIEPLVTERTRAVIVVHLAGMPAEMDEIVALCRDKGLLLVEDCAQAHGALYRGRPVGSFGDASAFSFCQDKIITTGGEGGLIVCSDDAVATRAIEYKDHGKDPVAVAAAATSGSREFQYVHLSFGTNFRMMEVQAVLGLYQLERLEDSVAKRRENAKFLEEGFSAIEGVETIPEPDWARHAYYKFYALLDSDRLAEGWDRGKVLAAVAAEGVPVASGSCPDLGGEKAFDGLLHASDPRPVAAEIGRRTMMFQVHPTLSEREMTEAVQALSKVMKAARRA